MRNRRGASAGMALLVLVSLVVVCAIAPAGAFAKTRTVLKASLNKSTCTYGSPATLTGVLKTSTGKAIRSQYVSLYRGSTKIGRYKTSKSGKVTVKVKYAGKVSWRYKYAGSKKYRSSASSSKTTTPKWVVNRSFHGESISGTVSLVAGRSYQWFVSAKAPTITVSNSKGTTVLHKVLGTQTITDSSGTETTYYWWNDLGTFKGPQTGSSTCPWSVKAVYLASRTGYFRIW